jgi:hypothetical protein
VFWIVFLEGETYAKTAAETLHELEWCLVQLEKMQTHRPVADMATSKVSQSSFFLALNFE